jgi:mRNA-degrading endonuclease toxin of MazEF toxin-antitoxin module
MVIPFTSKELPLVPFHVSLVFQGKSAKILTEQMRVIDKSRIGKNLGRVDSEILKKVEDTLHLILVLKN